MSDPALPAEPEDPPPRRWRRWLVAAAAMIALLVALRLALPGLAGAVLREQLAAAGLPSPRLTVSSIGLQHLNITGLQLGTGDEASVDKVQVSYDLGALLQGRIRRLQLHGVRIKASLADGRISLGSLDRALAGEGRGDGALLPPQLSITDGVLSLKLPNGLVAASFAGEFGRAADDRLTGQLGVGGTLAVGDFGAQLSGRLEAALGKAATTLSLTLDIVDPHYGDARFAAGRLKLVTQPAGGSFELALGGPGDPLELSAGGQLSRPAGRIAVTGRVALAAKPGAPIWPLLRLPQPQQGTLALAAELAGAASDTRLDWGSVDWHGTAEARLDQLTVPGLAGDLRGTARLALAGRGEAVTASLPEELRLEGVIDDEPLQAMPGALRSLLTGPLVAVLRGGSQVKLDPAAVAPLALDLSGALSHKRITLTYGLKGSGDLSGFKGDLTGSLAVPLAQAGALTLEDLAIDLGGPLAVQRTGATFRLADGHRIVARRVAFGGNAAQMGNLVLPLQPGPAPLLTATWSGPDGLRLQHSLSVGPGKIAGLKLSALPGAVDVAWQGCTSSGATAAGGYGVTFMLDGGSVAAHGPS
jgi:hypothetical protein